MKFKKWIVIGLILLSSMAYAASTDYKVDNTGRVWSYDLITKSPWVDVRSFMDGQSGRPTYAQYLANKNIDNVLSLQAAVDSFGTTSYNRPGILIVPGPIAISDTVLFERKSIRVIGPGWGSSTGGGTPGGYVKWLGTAGKPMFRIWQCEGMYLGGFRFIGNSAAKPSAAIDMHQLSTDGFVNMKNHIEDIYIGDIGGFDSDIAEQFTAGISFSGDNNNNEQNYFNNSFISRVGTGVDIQNGANAGNNFTNLSVQFASVAGVNAQGHTWGTNWVFSHNAIDIIVGGNFVSVNGLMSEYSGRLATVNTNCNSNLKIDGGYWAITNQLNADKRMIDGVMNGNTTCYPHVEISNFAFASFGGYGGTPTISIKETPGHIAGGYLKLSNVSDLTSANIDMNSGNAGNYNRRVIDITGGDFTLQTTFGNNGVVANGLPIYANNAAALADGLIAGDRYRSGADPDVIYIVH